MDNFGPVIQRLSVQLVPFIMAVVFHEYAHGFVANLWGDRTARDSGRLTLNPIPHMDPIGTILFPVINMVTGIPLLIGWARPVPINPARFRKYRQGLFFVSLAGPAMNVLLAFLAAIVVCGIVKWMPSDFYLFDPLVEMCRVAIQLNYALAFFNLVPLPPLDGSKVVESFLSYEATKKYEKLSQYSFFIFMALLVTGAWTFLLGGPIQFAYSRTLWLAVTIFGIS